MFWFFEHSFYRPPQFYTPLGGNSSYMSLPHLSKQLRDQNNKQKQQKNKNQDFTKNHYLLVFTIFIIFLKDP